MTLELIIFDCDGVLVDSEIIASEVLSNLLNECGYETSISKTRQHFMGLSINKIVTKVRNEGISLPSTFKEDLFSRDQAAFEDKLRPIPNIKTALSLIKVPKCIASSGSMKKIQSNLELTNLTPYFMNKIFSVEMVKNSKPSPDLFLLAADSFGVEPKKCLVIEDSEVGVKAAKRANMNIFGFLGGRHCRFSDREKLLKAGADQIFDKMQNLPTMINMLLKE